MIDWFFKRLEPWKVCFWRAGCSVSKLSIRFGYSKFLRWCHGGWLPTEGGPFGFGRGGWMLVIPCVKKNPRESLCCFRSGIRSYSVGWCFNFAMFVFFLFKLPKLTHFVGMCINQGWIDASPGFKMPALTCTCFIMSTAWSIERYTVVKAWRCVFAYLLLILIPFWKLLLKMIFLFLRWDSGNCWFSGGYIYWLLVALFVLRISCWKLQTNLCDFREPPFNHAENQSMRASEHL